MRNSVRWIIIIILLLITVVLGIVVSTQQSDETGSLVTAAPTRIPVSTGPVATVSQTTINLYFVALEDAGEQGEEIGCNDSIVAVERTLPQANCSSIS